MFAPLTWLALVIAAFLLYLYRVYTSLSRRGINHRPVVPLFGNIFWTLMKKEHFVDTFMKSVNAFPDDIIVGHYDMVTPSIIVKDLEIIKRITTKDFEYFVDRRGFSHDEEPIFGKSLIMLKGEKWKAMRSTLSPAFTSSKIRLMVPFMVEVGNEMIKVLNKKITGSGNSYVDMEVIDLATRYANDVIASCAFGLKVDSQSEDNLFYRMSKDVTSFSLLRVLKIMLFRMLPERSKNLKIELVKRSTADFFTNTILETMQNREKHKILRNDMINILMQVRKGQLAHEHDDEDTDAGFATVEESSVGKKPHNFDWTDTDLVAQAVLFLFAGFDTISTTMAFTLQEIALNPDVQEKLAQEIREHDAKTDGQCDYYSIQSMTYLDMVISEGLRLWPAAGFINRTCVKDYNIGKPNSKVIKDLIIRKGDTVMFPIWAFHRDPKLFANT